MKRMFHDKKLDKIEEVYKEFRANPPAPAISEDDEIEKTNPLLDELIKVIVELNIDNKYIQCAIDALTKIKSVGGDEVEESVNEKLDSLFKSIIKEDENLPNQEELDKVLDSLITSLTIENNAFDWIDPDYVKDSLLNIAKEAGIDLEIDEESLNYALEVLDQEGVLKDGEEE
jgi:hypothetical protein